MSDIDLAHAAADYAAGDLDPSQAAAFERLMTAEPRLAEEVAGWRRLRAGLAGAEPGAVPDLSASILRRAAWQHSPAPRARMIAMPTWLAAATAACLGIAAGLSASVRWAHPQTVPAAVAAVEPIAWAEDGSAVLPSSDLDGREGYLPQAALSSISLTAPRITKQHPYPWLGIWIKPTDLVGPGPESGHLVVRVAADGPAAKLGLRAGDVLIRLNDCPLATPMCIARALRAQHPGDTVPIVYWSAADARMVTTTVVLEAAYE